MSHPDPEIRYARLAAGDVGRIAASAEPITGAITMIDDAHASMTGGTRTVVSGWTGTAATAFGQHAGTTSTALGRARGSLDVGGRIVSSAARSYGMMRQSADRVIEAWRSRPAGLDEAATTRLATSVDSALGQLQGAYEGTLRAYAKGFPTTASGFRPPPDEQTPIPGPPPEPTPDGGAGEFDSDPWYSKTDDYLFESIAYDAADAAELIGYTDAARHLRHYLGASGEDLNVDPDHIMRDVNSFQQAVDQTAASEINRIAAEAAASGQYGTPVQFTTPWQGHYLTKEEDANWFYAMGGIQYSVSGVVTVHPPEEPGGQPRVEVDYQTNVWDRYNWDEGKETNIGPITISDEQMAELHRAGVAQEYDMTGTSDTYHYEGSVPQPGQPNLPQAPDDRGGGRTDPGR
jgi:hypothetical protein